MSGELSEAEYDRMCLAVLAAEEMLNAANARIAELERAQNADLAAVARLMEQRDAANARAEAADLERRDAGDARMKAEARAEAAEMALNEMRAESDAAAMADRVEHAESEAAALRAETAKLRDERETYAAEVVDLRAEVERLRLAHSTNFAGEHKRSSALRNTRDTALSKLAAAESRLAEALAEVERLNERYNRVWRALDNPPVRYAPMIGAPNNYMGMSQQDEGAWCRCEDVKLIVALASVAQSSLAEARALLVAAGIGDVNAWDARRKDWLAANPESPRALTAVERGKAVERMFEDEPCAAAERAVLDACRDSEIVTDYRGRPRIRGIDQVLVAKAELALRAVKP